MANTTVNKVVLGNEVLLDLTADTVTPSSLMAGYTAHDASGSPITGTASAGSMVVRDEADSHGGTIRHITAGSVVQGTLEVTQNGTYDVAAYADVDVDVAGSAPSLQTKQVTPSTSQQIITADSGYDGLSQVTVSAMPSGSASTPATSITANPSISVNSSTGLITASVSGSKSVTPSVSAGYVSSGTAGTVSVSGSNTSQLTTQAAKTVTPSTSQQTAVAAGRYTTGAVTVAAMPSGTEGTPTATKGSVSNHAVSVTPSVTNSAGYISGGTKSGTAVSVSASELVSGTLSITENGTADVTNYASVDVNVSSGGGGGYTLLYSGTLGAISTSSTTAEVVTTIDLGSSAWTHEKILYISIWRTTGRYSTPQKPSSSDTGFLGTETFWLGGEEAYQYGQDPKSSATFFTTQIVKYGNGYSVSSGQYGVYPSQLTDAGVLTISKRYNSSYSSTVTGSYDIAVYLVDYPHGDPWFGRFS